MVVYCFFREGSVKILQLSFVIFVGEELTVFEFVRLQGRNVSKAWEPLLQTFQVKQRLGLKKEGKFPGGWVAGA